MTIRAIMVGLAALVIAPGAGVAQNVPAPDAPALTARGDFTVGVKRMTLVQPNQPDFLRVSAQGIPSADRKLEVEIWYPAVATGNQAPFVTYTNPTTSNPFIPLSKMPAVGTYTGQAARDAAPLHGKHFPLVVISHGFTNWADSFSYLGENLASKGYVVASIGHFDPDPYSAKGRDLAIGQVISRRTADQRFVIAELTKMATQAGGAFADVYDPANMALIGYSMGGFGAVTTAGAGYAKNSPIVKSPVGALIAPFTEGGAEETPATLPKLKAVVLMAAWGAQPPYRVWSPTALANITTPSLIIDGDLDDVVDFQNGTKYLFANMTHSDRYLLVYENARHNIAINGAPKELAPYFPNNEHWNEPVWRQDRIEAINCHFITAFLDAKLKGDAVHGAFLNVPTPKSNDATWPAPPNAYTGPEIATADNPATKNFWPGFQRRWAVGLELYHAQ